jgi:hypothetical protein
MEIPVKKEKGKRQMKKALFTLAIATLAISTVSYGQNKPLYAIANDDIAFGNMVSVFSSFKGVITETDYSTGGSGVSGGYFAEGSIGLQNNGKCLFVSNAGSETIAAFVVDTTNFSLAPAVGSPFPTGGNDAIFGVGLAVTPQNNALFATLDSDFEIAEFMIGKGCTLSFVGTVPENDYVGPMAITQDGNVLLVSGPNKSYIDAWTIGPGAQLTKLGTLNLPSVPCALVGGCHPTGLDTDKVLVSGGHTTAHVIAGNGSRTGASYITADLDETSGLSRGTPFTVGGGAALLNVESPWYGSAAHDDNYTGFLYLCAAGSGSSGTAGFYVNQVTGGIISSTAITSLVNSAASYASNCQSTGRQGNQKAEYVWQSGGNSSLDNTMYLYRVSATGGVTLFASKTNTAAQGNTHVLTIAAWPGRHGK